MLVFVLGACKSDEGAVEEEGTEETAAATEEQAENPAEEAAEPEPAPEPEPTVLELAEVVNATHGFAITVLATHDVNERTNTIDYGYEMPDRWTQHAAVHPVTYQIATEAQLNQHFRDSGFRSAEVNTTGEGHYTALSEPNEVAGNTQQKYRVYVPGFWVECGSAQHHLEFNQSICDSFRVLDTPDDGIGAAQPPAE